MVCMMDFFPTFAGIIFELFAFPDEMALKVAEEYLASANKYPNPPVPNVTRFQSGGGKRRPVRYWPVAALPPGLPCLVSASFW